MSKVSIILPTYNRAHLLARSIGSILNQTYSDFELIVIDDNSKDNTEEVVASFKDRRIKYIKNQNNQGPSGARNTGMAYASGEYIAFQDSDDEWVKDKLLKLIGAIEKQGNEYGMVCTPVYKIHKNGVRERHPAKSKEINSNNFYRELLKNCIVATPAAIIKRECFKELGGFDTEFKCYEDYDYFLRIAKKYKIIYINEPMIIQHYTPGSVNVPAFIIQAEMKKKIVEKHFEDYVKYKSLIAGKYYLIADALCMAGNLEEGIIYFKKAYRNNKLNIFIYLSLTLSYFSLFSKFNIYRIFRNPAAGLRELLKCFKR